MPLVNSDTLTVLTLPIIVFTVLPVTSIIEILVIGDFKFLISNLLAVGLG